MCFCSLLPLAACFASILLLATVAHFVVATICLLQCHLLACRLFVKKEKKTLVCHSLPPPAYFAACSELNKYQVLVVVDVPLPSAQFGYKDVSTQLVQLNEVSSRGMSECNMAWYAHAMPKDSCVMSNELFRLWHLVRLQSQTGHKLQETEICFKRTLSINRSTRALSQTCPASCQSPLQEAVWEFDTQAWGSGSAAVALGLLASELGAAQRVQPGVNCGGLFPPLSRPTMPLPGEPTLMPIKALIKSSHATAR
eukprot:1147884-Pelagomonas_calceolata.AAC.5